MINHGLFITLQNSTMQIKNDLWLYADLLSFDYLICSEVVYMTNVLD
jgi:hypothetical protein